MPGVLRIMRGLLSRPLAIGKESDSQPGPVIIGECCSPGAESSRRNESAWLLGRLNYAESMLAKTPLFWAIRNQLGIIADSA